MNDPCTSGTGTGRRAGESNLALDMSSGHSQSMDPLVLTTFPAKVTGKARQHFVFLACGRRRYYCDNASVV